MRVLEDAGLVSRSREAQRRPVHLEAEVLDLMTAWIERYRRQAEERYQRLDEVLAQLDGIPDKEAGRHTRQGRRNRIMTITQPQTRPDSDYREAAIEADPTVPAIHIWRDFAATPAQLLRAHTDPGLFVRWSGPDSQRTTVEHWDAVDGGSWRFTHTSPDGTVNSFHGCFHTVREDRLVQTFTWDGMPDEVSLETMAFEDLGDGRTRMHAVSLCGSFEARDGWLASGMETGIHQGYAAIDRLLADGDL